MTRALLVRADGNARIGLGHVMRCMAVADELKRVGVATTFLSRALPDWVEERLRARGHAVRLLDLAEDSAEVEDAAATATVLAELEAIRVLLDHYGLSQGWTNKLRSETDVKIAAFDDLVAEPRDVDLLVDPSPGRLASEYGALVPAGAVVLTGSAYAPLRPEFALMRHKEPASKRPAGKCRVLISMGGVDPTGASLCCLDALDGRDDVTLTVVLGSTAPMLEETRLRVAQMQTPTRLLLDRHDMAQLIQDSDLVIGAGGTSSLERCALGRASALVVLADNQINNAAQLARAEAAVVIPELTPDTIRRTVEPLLRDRPRREAMGNKAAALCDGLGAPRVAAAVTALGTGVALRPAAQDDMMYVYQLQSEPGARRYSGVPTVPTLEEHQLWYTARLARLSDNPFHIVTLHGKPCGFVRLDRQAETRNWEVSILVSQTAQGQGVAHTALGLLRLTHPRHQIVASVHPENTPSQRLFEGAGYQRQAKDRFQSLGWAEIERRRHAD